MFYGANCIFLQLPIFNISAMFPLNFRSQPKNSYKYFGCNRRIKDFMVCLHFIIWETALFPLKNNNFDIKELINSKQRKFFPYEIQRITL